MQCTGKSGHKTALPSIFCFWFFLCAVFLCFYTTGCEAYSFTDTDGYGIFNMRTNWDACRTHEGGSGTKKNAQLRVDSEGTEKLVLTLPRQGIEPRVFGLEFRRSG